MVGTVELLAARPLGKGWPSVRRWKVTDEHELDGVELRSTRRADHYVLAHRAITGSQPWQATWFDADGAGGDLRRATLEEALNEQAPASEYIVTAIHHKAHRTRSNPTMAPPTKAIRMFRRFHTRDWRGEGDFHRDLVIPDQVQRLGPAVHVLYASDKLNPTTGEDEGWIEYIHEHGPGVHAYRVGGPGQPVNVPAWIRNVTEFAWLGRCLGFAYRDEDGREQKADATQPVPELYAIPSGKALLVIQSKRKLLALIWGGKLAVERRGIVH